MDQTRVTAAGRRRRRSAEAADNRHTEHTAAVRRSRHAPEPDRTDEGGSLEITADTLVADIAAATAREVAEGRVTGGARGRPWETDGGSPLIVAGRWEDAGVIRSFSTAAANEVLLDFVRTELAGRPGLRVLDLGCGAARNAAPMAAEGATVIGTDVAWPMLEAARRRVEAAGVGRRVAFVRAPMDHLPLRDASVDLVVAHGIWNLARSAAELRRAIAEAARVARPGAGLFVFTFSRATLAPGDQPVPGEPFVFTQFAGEPQCFLTETELTEELLRVGFEKDPPGPLTEYNRPVAGRTLTRGGPVIFEGTFRAVRHS